jgi:anti-sigma28 factor (negative regulator of flagellin synthesis)
VIILKKRRKKVSKAMMILMLIVTGTVAMPYSVYAAENTSEYTTETATNVFYTDDESTYDFSFAEEKEDEDSKYSLDHVEYDKQKISNGNLSVDESVTKTSKNVSKDYVAENEINENGYTYILKNSEVVQENIPVFISEYKDTGFVSGEPEVDETMEYMYVDSEGVEHPVTLPFSRKDVISTGYADSISYTGVISGLNYEYIQVGDHLVSSSDVTLTEDDIKKILTANGYNISDMDSFAVTMNPETYTDGNGDTCQNYSISAMKYGTKYRLYYEDTVDMASDSYTATDVYILTDESKAALDKANNTYEVTATAYYSRTAKNTASEKKMTTVQKVTLAAICVVLIILLVSLALYIISGGRRNTDYKTRRDVERDYRNL